MADKLKYLAETGEGLQLWEALGEHLHRLIVGQHGAVVVITAEDTPEGGLKSNYYTFFGEQFKSLKAFANLFPEMAQEAEAKLRKEFLPEGPVN
jgi:hypothetical protein